MHTSTATDTGTYEIRDGLHNWLGEVGEVAFKVGEFEGKLWAWRTDSSEDWSFLRFTEKSEAVAALLDALWEDAMEEDLRCEH